MLKVIELKSELASFKWNDGLFAIQKEEDSLYHLWKIKNGKLSYYQDNKTPNITCTGINNKGIFKTDMLIKNPNTHE